MRLLAFPLLLAAAVGCATSGRTLPERPNDEIGHLESLLDAAELAPTRVERLALRARAGESGSQLAEDLSRVARQLDAMSRDLASQSEALLASYPGTPRAIAADRRASVLTVKLREWAAEASAAASAVSQAGSGLPAPTEGAGAQDPGAEPDVLVAAAAQAARALAPKLGGYKSRSLVVTPAMVSFGEEMPKLALAFGTKGGQSEIYGRVFARRLAGALAREGLKATFSSDVSAQLAAAPATPLSDPSDVHLLVYGAVAMSLEQSAAWDLRAVDLNDDGIVAESQGVHRAAGSQAR